MLIQELVLQKPGEVLTEATLLIGSDKSHIFVILIASPAGPPRGQLILAAAPPTPAPDPAYLPLPSPGAPDPQLCVPPEAGSTGPEQPLPFGHRKGHDGWRCPYWGDGSLTSSLQPVLPPAPCSYICAQQPGSPPQRKKRKCPSHTPCLFPYLLPYYLLPLDECKLHEEGFRFVSYCCYNKFPQT